ncbi:MAG: hypothetical protein ACQEQE_02855 [Bacillota bacterium]
MVKLIAGKKGIGKSKQMIQLANDEVEKSDGNIVYLDDNDRNIFDLDHNIRFIDISEYDIKSVDGFVGFISGMLSRDYDIDKIFIDGILKSVKTDVSLLPDIFKKLEMVSDKNDVCFYLSASHAITGLPSELEKYLY